LPSCQRATLVRIEPADLRRRACEEADELGPEPANRAERELWREERRGAVVLLAGLADDDPAKLRRAALEVAGEWADRDVNALLLDAAALAGCGEV
jgi:hypothetical protein